MKCTEIVEHIIRVSLLRVLCPYSVSRATRGDISGLKGDPLDSGNYSLFGRATESLTVNPVPCTCLLFPLVPHQPAITVYLSTHDH